MWSVSYWRFEFCLLTEKEKTSYFYDLRMKGFKHVSA